MAVLTRALPALALAACASPISNAPFTEEAEFLAAFPAATAWSAPIELTLAPLGDDPVLRAAKESAAAWDGLVEGPVTIGEALRGREPDERTDVARRWSRREIVANLTGPLLGAQEPRRVWVDAEVVRLEDGTFRATVRAAPDADAPLVEVGTCERDGDALSAAWDLDLLAAAWGVDAAPGGLALTLDETPDPSVRKLQGTVGEGPRTSTWSIADLDRMGFAADLALTADERTWPATVEVRIVPEAGGRASGVLYQGDAEPGFDACWDAAGDTVFRGGDDGVVRTGDRAACVE